MAAACPLSVSFMSSYLSDPSSASHSYDQIIDAASALIAEHGFGGMSMRGLAQRIGMQAGSIYHHFNSKQDVLGGVLEQLHARRFESWMRHKPKNSEPLVLLSAFLAFNVDRQLHNHDEERIINLEVTKLNAAQISNIQRECKRYVAELEYIIRVGQAKGIFRMANTQSLAHAILGICSCARSLHNAGGYDETHLNKQMMAMSHRLLTADLH